MEAIEEEINFLKTALNLILIELGGEAMIDDFEVAFIKKYGKFVLQVCFVYICWMFLKFKTISF